MSDRLLLRRLALALLLTLTIAAKGTVVARNCTDLRRSLLGSDDGLPCHASTDRPEYSEEFELWVRTNCASGGWRGEDGSRETLRAVATGECAASTSGGGPTCPGRITGGPTDGGLAGGQLLAYLNYENMAYDYAGRRAPANALSRDGGRPCRP